MNLSLPPPAIRSDEEPIAAGGRQWVAARAVRCFQSERIHDFPPPPVTQSDEEPIATGGRWI